MLGLTALLALPVDIQIISNRLAILSSRNNRITGAMVPAITSVTEKSLLALPYGLVAFDTFKIFHFQF